MEYIGKQLKFISYMNRSRPSNEIDSPLVFDCLRWSTCQEMNQAVDQGIITKTMQKLVIQEWFGTHIYRNIQENVQLKEKGYGFSPFCNILPWIGIQFTLIALSDVKIASGDQ